MISAVLALTSAYATSSPARSWARCPKESSAPALRRASTARLLSALRSTRSRKSNMALNGPPDSRASIRALTAEAPTPRTAPNPKRI